ncbi:hypothetical protein ACFFRR_004371 [Megaselia abdita]
MMFKVFCLLLVLIIATSLPSNGLRLPTTEDPSDVIFVPSSTPSVLYLTSDNDHETEGEEYHSQAEMEEACAPCCESGEHDPSLDGFCETCDCAITLSHQLLKTIGG